MNGVQRAEIVRQLRARPGNEDLAAAAEEVSTPEDTAILRFLLQTAGHRDLAAMLAPRHEQHRRR